MERSGHWNLFNDLGKLGGRNKHFTLLKEYTKTPIYLIHRFHES